MQTKKEIPVIFLTALDEEKDIVKGFDLGADEYITKPVSYTHLIKKNRNVNFPSALHLLQSSGKKQKLTCLIHRDTLTL